MPALPKGHYPVRYNLLFESVASARAYSATVAGGDIAEINDDTFFPRPYIYNPLGDPATDDGLTIIAGPGGVGTWELYQLAGEVRMSFAMDLGSLTFVAASDPSIHTKAPATLSIARNGVGDFNIVFLAGSILRPTVAEPIFGSVILGLNNNGCGFGSAYWDQAHTIRVKTATANGLPDGPVYADVDFSLAVSMPGY